MSDPSPGAAGRAFVALQHLLPQHGISRLVLAATRSRSPAFKNALIRLFVRGFRPDMSDAVSPTRRPTELQRILHARVARGHAAHRYRAARRGLAGRRHGERGGRAQRRPPAAGQGTPLQPARVARRQYPAGSAPSPAAVSRLSTWRPTTTTASTWRCAGELRDSFYVPGRLFSVNRTTASLVPGLFSRNERVFCGFDGGGTALGHHPGRRAQCRQHGHGVARRCHPAQAPRSDRASGQRRARAGHAGEGRRDGALQHGLHDHPAVAARRRRMERHADRRSNAAHGRTHRHLASWPRETDGLGSRPMLPVAPHRRPASLRRRAQALRRRANFSARAACSKSRRQPSSIRRYPT